MIIKDFNTIEHKIPYLATDQNGREINIFNLKDSILTGESLLYPNPLFYCLKDKQLYTPLKERAMSLKNEDLNKDYGGSIDEVHTEIETDPVFFFIYNTDNYYHFVYDTLPILLSYFHLKKQINNLKLLMSYPNHTRGSFYNFVTEFLQILDINISTDIIIAKSNILYKDIYISNSYTHDINSNLPPRNEVYSLYNTIINTTIKDSAAAVSKKIYISRRTWLHNDFSNIGTNYTTRRLLVNEDDLVSTLAQDGYEEVFTENLSTKEKILLFYNAKNIIGAIGGGMCNILFTKKETPVTVIVSPTFLEVNNRFKYSFYNKNITYFTDTEHTEKTTYKKYMRVKIPQKNIIGEIVDMHGDDITVSYLDNKVAGWNSEIPFNKIIVKNEDCIALDAGLNSAWRINLHSFK